MAWTESIQEASYTGPNNKKIVFSYTEDLSRNTDIKASVNTFPGVDGAEVKHLGLGARKFPMTALFYGANCMTEADAFENLLGERGYGILEHPIYGQYKVVPSGTIERSDNLVSALNESRVKITFIETIVDEEYPSSKISKEDALDQAVADYEEAAVFDFVRTIEISNVDDKMDLQATLKKQGAGLFKGVDDIAELASDMEEKQDLLQTLKGWKNSYTAWVISIDQLADKAGDIARLAIKAARVPAQITINALAKVEGYASIVKDTINNIKKDPYGSAAVRNQWAATSTMIGSCICAMSWGTAKTALGAVKGEAGISASAGGFMSRAAMFNVCDAIMEQLEIYKEYMDSQTAKDVFADTGETYEALYKAVLASIQLIQEVSFDLPMTRIVVLDRDRQLIELLCEFYGEQGFDRMDEFIVDNNLNANELVVIPMGRKVRYYE